jgi:hypothetical protein
MIQTLEETASPKPHTPAPGVTTHPEQVDPEAIRLFRHPPWRLRMTIEGDRSYLKVKIVRAAPLSHPGQYICFLDEKDEVITMVKDPAVLDDPTRRIVQEELAQRYLCSVILRVHSVRSEFGVSYWDVETSRGRREFVIQNVSESAQWFGEHHVMLIDVDTNRFEIPDITALDKKSRSYIGLVL